MAKNRGYGGKTRVGAALVVLSLLVLDATAFPSVRSSVFADMLARRGLSDSAANKPRTIALDLMDIQHVDSPFRQPNLTLEDRVKMSVANSKRRTLASTDDFTTPLQSVQASYIMQITVGTPARTFVAIADTGSDLVWLQCTPSTCVSTDCVQIPDQPFDPTASSSYSSMSCDAVACQDLGDFEQECPSTGICAYDYSYGDMTSTSGSMAYETFTFTDADGSTTGISNVAFGCGADDESNTFHATDGLVGLGQGPLSLPSQLIAGSIIDPVFSYCLVDYSSATTVTSPLLLGSAGKATQAYTPLVPNTISPFGTFYYVNLLGITVNNQSISYPAGTFDIDDTTGEGGIIFDSGTTITSLFDDAYTPFQSAISSLITYPTTSVDASSGFSLCYDTSDVSGVPVFPSVSFQFENVTLDLGFNNTFLLVDNAGTYCLAFQTAGTSATNSVFGNIQQSNFEISYDVGNLQVGFAANAC